MSGNGQEEVASVSSSSSCPTPTTVFSSYMPSPIASSKNVFTSCGSHKGAFFHSAEKPKITAVSRSQTFTQSSSGIFSSPSWFVKGDDHTPAFTKSFSLFPSATSSSSLFKKHTSEVSGSGFQNEFRWPSVTVTTAAITTTTAMTSATTTVTTTTALSSSSASINTTLTTSAADIFTTRTVSDVVPIQQPSAVFSHSVSQTIFCGPNQTQSSKENSLLPADENHLSSTFENDIPKVETNTSITPTFAKMQRADTFSFVKAYKEASEKAPQKCVSDTDESCSSQKNEIKEILNKDSLPFMQSAKQQRPALKSKLTEGLFGKALAGVHSSKYDVSDLENQQIVFATNTRPSNLDIKERCTLSSEELLKITAIVCTNLPESLNNKNLIRNHFSKFGRVKRVNCNPKKDHCIVHFIDHESAEAAKKYGSLISEEYPPFPIFWTQTLQKSAKTSIEGDSSLRRFSSSLKGTCGTTSLQSEIDDELRAMAEGSEDHAILERPETLKSKMVETGSSKHVRSSKDSKCTTKESKSLKETKYLKETKSPKEAKSAKESKSSKESRSPKDSKTSKHYRSSKESKIIKEVKISKDVKSLKEKSTKDVKSTKDKIKKESGKSKTLTENISGKLPTHDNTEESLLAVIESMAHSEEDRYHILDARDKLMRLRQQKNSDLATAIATVGTCPDMCPEKERYSRHTKNNLSVFEMKTAVSGKMRNEIDHKAVVKEYSRPSADQEEPLPHELRPPHVLEITINHLLCNTVDCMDDSTSVGEWYDFIWNRTRAIRKDITQQHLCDLTCVEMVEKCARFHIHCAAVLCEKDMATFDAKINNENLTKCLQTLKHLYHDLGEKGVRCSHEEEFRCYDVLLNLNKGDILREVQQLSEDIQKSQMVKFAVQTFSALNSNNYVRFFRLVQEAPYLIACLMHGYFAQVRIRALHTILKAYSRHSHSQQYPIQELVRILAFENVHEAQYFCQWLGLKADDKFVVLDRIAFAKPVSSPPISRAYKLVESKRTLLVGEVINGGQLLPNPYHTYQPHDSFNSEGYLKKEAYYASDQAETVKQREKKIMLPEVTTPSIPVRSQQPENLPEEQNVIQLPVTPFDQYPLEEEMTIEKNSPDEVECLDDYENNDELLNEVGEDLIIEVIAPVMKECSLQLCLTNTANKLFHHYILFEVDNLVRELCKEVVSEELAQLEKTKLAILETEKKAATAVSEELILDVLYKLLRGISRDVYIQLKNEWLDQMSIAIWKSLENSLNSELVLLASQVYRDEQIKLQAAVQDVKERILMKRVKRMFLRWQNVCNQRQRLHSTRRTFPCGPPLYGNCPLLLSGSKIRSTFEVVSQQDSTSKLLGTGTYYNLLREELSWYPLNVADIIWKVLLHEYTRKPAPKLLCWKLIMFLPSVENSDMCPSICEWLCAKFSKGYLNEQNKHGVRVCSLYHTEVEEKQEIAVCVKAISTPVSSDLLQHVKSDRTFIGTSAILIVLSSTNLDQSFTAYGYQLKKLLQTKPIFPPVPLYLFLVGSQSNLDFLDENKQMVKRLILEELKTEGLICDYTISLLDVDISHFSATQKLNGAVEWLAEHKPPEPDLVSTYLKDYLEDGFIKFVFNVIYEDLADRQSRGIYNQSLVAILSLYNTAIEHLASVVSALSLKQLSWPIPEFVNLFSTEDRLPACWNTEENLELLKKSILNFQLPSHKQSDCDVEKVDVWYYVNEFANKIGQDATDLFSRVNYLLLKGEKLAHKMQQELIIPWADIINTCIRHALTCTDFTDSEGHEYMVHYFQEEFENFQFPEEWIIATRELMSKTVKGRFLSKRHHSCDIQEEPLNKRSLLPPLINILPQSPSLIDIKHLSQKLNKALNDEKEVSKSFATLLDVAKDETKCELGYSLPFHLGKDDVLTFNTEEETIKCSNIFDENEPLMSKISMLQSLLKSQQKATQIFEESLQVLLDH